MNSIFTNALPGENEDEHIYTLKELFNQNNNNENNDNNNDHHHNFGSNNSQIMDQRERDISPSNKYKEYNSKDYSDSNNNKMMDYTNNSFNRNRSNSKSSSRSHGRERERSRDRERERERERRESSSRKYSRSNSRNYRRTHPRNDDYHKRYEKPKNTGRAYQKPYSKFCCVENGINKISTQFTVPEHLVSILIGKNGENVKSIMHSTGASVTFCKEVSFNFTLLIYYSIMMTEKLIQQMEWPDCAI